MLYFSSIPSSLHQHSVLSPNVKCKKFCSLNAFSVLQRAVLWLTVLPVPIIFQTLIFNTGPKKREEKNTQVFWLNFPFSPTTKCKIGQDLGNHTGTAKCFHLCIKQSLWSLSAWTRFSHAAEGKKSQNLSQIIELSTNSYQQLRQEKTFERTLITVLHFYCMYIIVYKY